ncbi:MAG TPA: PKD domain-containing protein, partial [Vicinamibacterales bacterium]|nr:PKD domain-containing protein [Vicinamibacterales bacterium]
SRQVELLLIPQGVILPSNPNLVASFSATPNPALVLQTVAFDASATTASGTDGARALCDTRCTYSWSFGDGRSGSGIRPFHTYTTIGTYLVTLTVVDPLGAQAQTTQTQTVNPGVPPTATFSFSPSSPGIDQVIFFNATAARPATGRTIVSYDWDFGDGTKASGMTTTHSYKSAGQFPVILRVTDDAGTVGQVTPPTTITVTATAGVPTAAFTFSPTAPAVNQQVFFDGSTSRPLASNQPISQYRWDFGDGSPDEVSENSRVTHVFRRAGTYVVRLTVTDSTGKIGTTTVNVAIQ